MAPVRLRASPAAGWWAVTEDAPELRGIMSADEVRLCQSLPPDGPDAAEFRRLLEKATSPQAFAAHMRRECRRLLPLVYAPAALAYPAG